MFWYEEVIANYYTQLRTIYPQYEYMRQGDSYGVFPDHHIFANDANKIPPIEKRWVDQYMSLAVNFRYIPKSAALIVGNGYCLSTCDKIPSDVIFICDIDPLVGRIAIQIVQLIRELYRAGITSTSLVEQKIIETVAAFLVHAPMACPESKENVISRFYGFTVDMRRTNYIAPDGTTKALYTNVYNDPGNMEQVHNWVAEQLNTEKRKLGKYHYLSSRSRFSQCARVLLKKTVSFIDINFADPKQVAMLAQSLGPHKFNYLYLTNLLCPEVDPTRQLANNLRMLPIYSGAPILKTTDKEGRLFQVIWL